VPIKQNSVQKQENLAQDYNTLQELGDNFLAVGDNDQAQQCYEKAAIFDTDAAAPYVGIGTVAMREGLPDDAALAFRVACRLDPNCSRAYEGLGRVAQKNENYEKAFEMYLKCLELDTNNLAALLGLFQASSQMGSFAKIIHYLEVYLKMHPDDSSVMFSLATLYIKEDLFDKSKTMLLKILESAPDNKDAENLIEEVERNLAREKSA
jgi:tetratricopeptide (TPR) repeat protein